MSDLRFKSIKMVQGIVTVKLGQDYALGDQIFHRGAEYTSTVATDKPFYEALQAMKNDVILICDSLKPTCQNRITVTSMSFDKAMKKFMIFVTLETPNSKWNFGTPWVDENHPACDAQTLERIKTLLSEARRFVNDNMVFEVPELELGLVTGDEEDEEPLAEAA